MFMNENYLINKWLKAVCFWYKDNFDTFIYFNSNLFTVKNTLSFASDYNKHIIKTFYIFTPNTSQYYDIIVRFLLKNIYDYWLLIYSLIKVHTSKFLKAWNLHKIFFIFKLTLHQKSRSTLALKFFFIQINFLYFQFCLLWNNWYDPKTCDLYVNKML